MASDDKDILEGVDPNLVRQAQAWLISFFVFAFGISLAIRYEVLDFPDWVGRYALQGFLGIIILFLSLQAWPWSWQIKRGRLKIVFCFFLGYFLLLWVSDLSLSAWFGAQGYIAPSIAVEAFVLKALMAPILEELFFRDYLFRSLWLQWQSKWRAVFFTSGFFMLAHLSLYPGAFLLSIVTCLLFAYSRSVVPGIVFHSLSNLSWYFLPAWFPSLYKAIEQLSALNWFYQ